MVRKSDAAFFSAFTNHAQLSVVAARRIERLFANEPRDAAQIAREVTEAEHKADDITHETIRHLHTNWFLALDRSDVHELIVKLDDVMDFLEAASERAILFELESTQPAAHELSGILVQCCETMAEAVQYLAKRETPGILEACKLLSSLEAKADAIYRRALAQLYRGKDEVLTVMKWRDVYDILEGAIDRCLDVANVLEGIALEG